MKKFILVSIAFISFMPIYGQSKKAIKKDLQASIERQKDKLIDISYAIWEAAETSLEEFTSSKILMDYARENGFEVTENIADIPTAFTASYGSGRPIIGILGEFDANAGISQKLQPYKEARIKGAAGHGCGHNLYGTASLGAAIAIKEQIEKGEEQSHQQGERESRGHHRQVESPCQDVQRPKLQRSRQRFLSHRVLA